MSPFADDAAGRRARPALPASPHDLVDADLPIGWAMSAMPVKMSHASRKLIDDAGEEDAEARPQALADEGARIDRFALLPFQAHEAADGQPVERVDRLLAAVQRRARAAGSRCRTRGRATPARRAMTKWPTSWTSTSATRMASRTTMLMRPSSDPCARCRRRARDARLTRPGAHLRVEGLELVGPSACGAAAEARHRFADQGGDAGEAEAARPGTAPRRRRPRR